MVPLYSTVLVKLNVLVVYVAGNVPVPPIFKVAPFDTLTVPPATVVPRFAVYAERSNIPAATRIFPVDEDDEFNAGRLAASDFVPAPDIFKVE